MRRGRSRNSRRGCTNRIKKRRDQMARALEDPLFQPQVIPSKRAYDRKKEKPGGVRQTKAED